MTAQISDSIWINEENFSVVGVNGNDLFIPQAWGINPVATVSSCWRGYVCQYKIQSNKLILDNLQVSFGIYENNGIGQAFVPQTSTAINGVIPNAPGGDYPLFNNIYENLGLEINFSGGILAGNGFIHALYVHMGFHPAWKYHHVHELILAKGNTQEIRDVSGVIEKIRNKMIEHPLAADISESSQRDFESWIEKSFRLNYNLNQ